MVYYRISQNDSITKLHYAVSWYGVRAGRKGALHSIQTSVLFDERVGNDHVQQIMVSLITT